MSLTISNKAFKAYDIRGRVPDELNEDIAYRLGKAFVAKIGAKTCVVGNDIRLSGQSLSDALCAGLRDAGCDVYHIGLCGTEEIYFATSHLDVDGGIMITASHNPIDYNGMKMVRRGSRPISADSGLKDIEELVVKGAIKNGLEDSINRGRFEVVSTRKAYIEHLLGYINISELKPLKVVVNAGNGCAGPIIDELEKYLPIEFIKLNNEPDGKFPNGIPNPILVDQRENTAKFVREHQADLGIAWDGDFDRCFLFDENGDFIEGYYIVGFLAEAFLRKCQGAKVIYDPRLIWNTIEIAESMGGKPVMSKSGHAFIKEKMRAEDAVYGGEMSAHHYFKDFFYCDSGMIPWLLVIETMCIRGKKLSELVNARIEKFPVSGEINSTVKDAKAIIKNIEELYGPSGKIDKTDGISIEYDDWRFNLRMSNTEPLLRLNVETRSNKKLMAEKTAELLKIIKG